MKRLCEPALLEDPAPNTRKVFALWLMDPMETVNEEIGSKTRLHRKAWNRTGTHRKTLKINAVR